MRVFRGQLPFAARHLGRLREGLRFLGFAELTLADAAILGACLETARRIAVQDGFVRLSVSRAGGARGFAPPAAGASSRPGASTPPIQAAA